MVPRMTVSRTVLGRRGRSVVLQGISVRYVAHVSLNLGAVASVDVATLVCCARDWSRRET